MMNILLPTDFSGNSRNAAAYALQFFRGIPCTFHFLHISPPSLETLSQGQTNMPQTIQEKFDELLNWVNGLGVSPDHHFSICYKVHHFIEAIRAKIAEKNIDLILMGTKGASNQKEIILGKNTSDVVTKVKCPTLAISENAQFQPQKEILFPTDYKIRYSSKMLESLKNITSLSKTSIRILELFGPDNEPNKDQLTNRKLLKLSLLPQIPDTQEYYSFKGPESKFLFWSNRNVDMIVMAAKNLNLCQKLLKDHNNHQIPFIGKLPLLILHD